MGQILFNGRHGESAASEEAATAVEYAIVVGLVAAVIIAIVATLGLQTANLYERTITSLDEATSD